MGTCGAAAGFGSNFLTEPCRYSFCFHYHLLDSTPCTVGDTSSRKPNCNLRITIYKGFKKNQTFKMFICNFIYSKLCYLLDCVTVDSSKYIKYQRHQLPQYIFSVNTILYYYISDWSLQLLLCTIDRTWPTGHTLDESDTVNLEFYDPAKMAYRLKLYNGNVVWLLFCLKWPFIVLSL